MEHKQTASFHNAPATSQLTLKKSKKTKRQAGTCTGQVSIAVAEDTIGVGGGAAMIAMQQECERHFLPVYGTKAVLAKRLKEHFRDHRHHSSKRAKPKSISSFFASCESTKKTNEATSSSTSSSSSSMDTCGW